MAYEYEHGHRNMKASVYSGLATNESVEEIKEVYRKARAWDRLYDMILDEDMTVREFDDEMYELLKQTGKTDIRIITDPSIRMEDE